MKKEYVWKYIVYWISFLDTFHGNLRYQEFSLKKDATKFAKKKFKEKKVMCKEIGDDYNYIKPFIYKKATLRDTFDKKTKVEFLTEKQVKKYVNSWHSNTILVKY